MPRLRQFLDRFILSGVDQRSAPGEQAPGDASRLQYLADRIKEQEAEITRLKETDAKRSALYRKNAAKWRKKQTEVRKVREKNRVYRRLLRQRRDRLRENSQRLRELEHDHLQAARYQAYGISGDAVPQSFTSHPASNAFGWLTRLWADRSLLPWRHWMRLGSYFQYDPRPVECDAIPQIRRTLGNWPRISLVTPSYQQAAFLKATMDSVIGQDYPNLEYIVMDGGSTDGSVDLIRSQEARLAHWQSRPDGGQAAAVRAGLERSDGEIMAWLNSDDVIFPGTLAYVADYFQRNPDVDVVYGHRIILNEKGLETGRWILPPHDPEILPWADFIPQECTFWRRRIYEKVGGMNPDFQFALDWDLFLRFQRAGARIVRLPYFMGGFRIHAAQKNAVTIGTDGFREMRKIREEALGANFQRGGLHKRINWLQARAVATTWLWRMGIRW